MFELHWVDILIGVALFLIMFGIGASLTRKDFLAVANHPKEVGLGLVLQLVFLPLLALGLGYIGNLSPAFQLGLFLVAICPGGTTSNFVSYFVKADVALSVSLTAVNSFIILVTIPLLLSWGGGFILGQSLKVSVGSTIWQVFFVLILPAALGVVFHEQWPKLASGLAKPLKYINTVLLGAVFALKLFAPEGGSGLTSAEFATLMPYCLALHGIAMLTSYYLAKGAGISKTSSVTIGIEVGLQNTGLALFIAATLIGNNTLTKPALVMAMFSFFTTLLFAFATMRRNPFKMD